MMNLSTTRIFLNTERPIRPIVFFVLLLLLIISITLVTLRMDVTVTSNGNISTALPPLNIGAGTSGTLRWELSVHARAIEKGTIIARIENDFFLSQHSLLSNQLSILNSLITDTNDVLEFLEDVPNNSRIADIAIADGSAHSSGTSLLQSQLQQLLGAIYRLDQGYPSDTEAVALTQTVLDEIEGQLASVTELSERGISSDSQLRTATIAYTNALLDNLRAQQAQETNRAEREATISQISVLLAETRRTAFLELSTLILEKAEIESQIASIEKNIDQSVLRAPHDGEVANPAFHLDGSYVSQGDNLGEFIPATPLIVLAKIPSRDIALVEIGQEARFRIMSNGELGDRSFDGIVAHVAPSPVQINGIDFFQTRIETNTINMDINAHGLRAGTPSIIYIKIGERTMAQYILGSLSDIFDNIFSDPA